MQKKMQKVFTVSYFKTLSELYQYKKRMKCLKKKCSWENWLSKRKEKDVTIIFLRRLLFRSFFGLKYLFRTQFAVICLHSKVDAGFILHYISIERNLLPGGSHGKKVLNNFTFSHALIFFYFFITHSSPFLFR